MCGILLPNRTSQARAAVIGRDWKRIEAELEDLLPAAPPLADGATPERIPQREQRPVADEEAVLKHIAEALRLD